MILYPYGEGVEIVAPEFLIPESTTTLRGHNNTRSPMCHIPCLVVQLPSHYRVLLGSLFCRHLMTTRCTNYAVAADEKANRGPAIRPISVYRLLFKGAVKVIFACRCAK